jgi:tetraacyldisaccharide-1-P 4'-kinase
VSGERVDFAMLCGKEVYAFCGIGNPESFRRTLQDTGCVIAGFRTFADHHGYTPTDVDKIEYESSGHIVVTTEKDAVRLPRAIGFALLIEADVPGLVEFAAGRAREARPPDAP